MAATDDRGRGPAELPLPGDGGVPEAGGVDLQPDVERIHRTVSREPHDPIEGRERPPWILAAAIAIALFWAGWYLGRYGGEFSTASHIAFAERETGIAAASAGQSAEAVRDPIAAGRAVYEKNCASCHQATGRGVPGVFPPLVGSEWVTGEPEIVVRILLHGMQGPIEVAGSTYNGAMPAWGVVLRDEEIAAVATYIRQLDGNDASAVPTELVKSLREADAARATPWTADELKRAAAAGAPPGDSGNRAPPTTAPRGAEP